MIRDQAAEDAIIRLEYKVAYLELMTTWLLNNAVFVKTITKEDIKRMTRSAFEYVRTLHPEADMSLVESEP